jgi:hypothetical protein
MRRYFGPSICWRSSNRSGNMAGSIGSRMSSVSREMELRSRTLRPALVQPRHRQLHQPGHHQPDQQPRQSQQLRLRRRQPRQLHRPDRPLLIEQHLWLHRRYYQRRYRGCGDLQPSVDNKHRIYRRSNPCRWWNHSRCRFWNRAGPMSGRQLVPLQATFARVTMWRSRSS